jgi:multidrug efflux pump
VPQFFINRPIFAWVIAIGIIIAGLIAIPQLPVARFPSIAPHR